MTFSKNSSLLTNEILTDKVYKQPGKIYIGVELLHVAQIDDDVK